MAKSATAAKPRQDQQQKPQAPQSAGQVAEAQAKADKRTDTAPPGIEFWKEEKAS